MQPLIVRIDADDIRSAEMLKKDGWREGDELTTYWRKSPWFGKPVHALPHDGVRLGFEEDYPAVFKIAKKAFGRDKEQWIRDTMRLELDKPWKKPCALFVHEDYKGRINGFVITKIEADATVIDLIGVSVPRKRIGAGLVMFSDLGQRPMVQAGTQTKNEAAKNFYTWLGFTVKHRRRTFHKCSP